MSAFSRGCLSSLRAFNGPKQAHLLRSSLLPRSFSSSSPLCAKKSSSTKGVLKTLKNSPSSTAVATPSRLSNYDSYASILAKKPHSTLLYTAPSHTGYRIANYFLSASFTGAALLSANIALRPSEGLPVWIPYIYGGAFVVCMALSWNFLQRSGKLVQSLTAIPSSMPGKAGVHGVKSGVQIEILMRRSSIPFMKPKKLLVAPEDIVIPGPFVKPSAKRVTEADLIASAKLEREAKAKRLEEWKYDRDHLMTSPFRHAKKVLGGAASEGWQGLKRSFNGEGFMEMRVKGKILKIDTRGGWALDGGRAIDRLVKLEPHAQSFL